MVQAEVFTVEGQEALAALRAQIDAIDDQMLDLVGKRAALARALAAAKAGGGPTLALRPAREVRVLRRLIARAPEGVDADLVSELWSALMGANVRRQQPMEALVSGAGDIGRLFDVARRHFGASMKITRVEDFRAALNRVQVEPGVVALLPWPGPQGPGGWWPILNERRYHKLSIVSALPMRGDHEPEGALIGADALIEEAGDDFTLGVAFDPHHRLVRALNESGLSGKELGRARETVLIRFDGFLSPTDPRVMVLIGHGLDGFRVVGSYARV